MPSGKSKKIRQGKPSESQIDAERTHEQITFTMFTSAEISEGLAVSPAHAAHAADHHTARGQRENNDLMY
jgi:hypothetical protein